MGKLSAAGFTLTRAKKWAVPADIRRQSVLESNVLALNVYAAKPKAEWAPAPKVKVAEKATTKKVPKKKTEG